MTNFNPNNSNSGLPHTTNFAVTRIGNALLFSFQGEHRFYRLHPVEIGTASLTINGLTAAASIALADREDGINYYNVTTLNIDLGSGSDTFNVQGTTATTNLKTHDGNDRIYVSDAAQFGLNATVDFLTVRLIRFWAFSISTAALAISSS